MPAVEQSGDTPLFLFFLGKRAALHASFSAPIFSVAVFQTIAAETAR